MDSINDIIKVLTEIQEIHIYNNDAIRNGWEFAENYAKNKTSDGLLRLQLENAVLEGISYGRKHPLKSYKND